MEEFRELINNEKYQDALKILLQKEGHYLEKIQCLYELEKYDELLTFYDSIKKDIDQDYYEIFGFIINTLIVKEDFDSALNLLNEELSLPYIPQDYQEIINDLYDDVVAIKQVYLHENNAYQLFNEEHVINTLENDEDYFNLYEVIIDLNKYNLRSLINSVEIFLKRDVSNILKTLLLEECLKQEINQTLLVIKDNIEYEFLCSANQYVEDEENYLKTIDILIERLEKTPSFLEMALTILASYSYIIYPLTIDEDEALYLALVIEYYIYTLNMEELNKNYEELGFSTEKIEAGFTWLENILKSESEYEHGLDKYQF